MCYFSKTVAHILKITFNVYILVWDSFLIVSLDCGSGELRFGHLFSFETPNDKVDDNSSLTMSIGDEPENGEEDEETDSQAHLEDKIIDPVRDEPFDSQDKMLDECIKMCLDKDYGREQGDVKEEDEEDPFLSLLAEDSNDDNEDSDDDNNLPQLVLSDDEDDDFFPDLSTQNGTQYTENPGDTHYEDDSFEYEIHCSHSTPEEDKEVEKKEKKKKKKKKPWRKRIPSKSNTIMDRKHMCNHHMGDVGMSVMGHIPCHTGQYQRKCWVNGRCEKHFPKKTSSDD